MASVFTPEEEPSFGTSLAFGLGRGFNWFWDYLALFYFFPSFFVHFVLGWSFWAISLEVSMFVKGYAFERQLLVI